MIMKFEIPFNAENDYQEKLFLWKYTWIKKIRSSWFSMLLMTGLFLILLIIPNNGFFYVIVTAVSLSVIMIYANHLFAIEKHKRKYLTNVKKRNETLIGTLLTYEFAEDYFIYTDDRLAYHIKWTEFEKFVSSSNILLIKLRYQHTANIILSKHEFGEDYSRIIGFLKTKLPHESF